MNSIYSNQLKTAVKTNDHTFHFPIRRMILIVQIYNLVSIVFIIFALSFFLGIGWFIYVKDFQNWQNIEFYDVFQGYQCFYTEEGKGWIQDDGSDLDENKILVRIWYYAITTLSTIGFGDYSPKSVNEKILGCLVLLFGVAVFSIIMNNLMDIFRKVSSLEDVGAPKDLSKWIAMLSKYNNGLPMSKDTIQQIETFFDYYWTCNKLNAFSTELDKRFMSELPESVTQKIYIDYLFKDFVY